IVRGENPLRAIGDRTHAVHGIRDTRRLLLAVALAPQRLVDFRILDRRTVLRAGHSGLLWCAASHVVPHAPWHFLARAPDHVAKMMRERVPQFLVPPFLT